MSSICISYVVQLLKESKGEEVMCSEGTTLKDLVSHLYEGINKSWKGIRGDVKFLGSPCTPSLILYSYNIFF